MADGRKTFLLYREWKEPINLLSDELAGILLKSFFRYWDGESLTFENDALKMISSFIIAQFDRDNEAYQRKCAANQENGKKGGRPKTQGNPTKPNETQRFSEKPRKADEGEEEKEDLYAAIADSYNRLCPSLPRCTKLSDKRKGQIKARLNEGYNLQDFEDIFRKAEESDFLSGRSGNWRITGFDWLINGGNMLKIAEGQYTNPNRQDNTQQAQFNYEAFGI